MDASINWSSGTTWLAMPKPVRLVAVDAVAGVLEQQRIAHADEPGQLPAGAVAGNQAHAGECLGEYSALGGDTDVAGQRHAHADAHGVPVDRGDGRLLQLMNTQRHQRGAAGVLHAVVAVGETGLHLAPGQGFRLAGRTASASSMFRLKFRTLAPELKDGAVPVISSTRHSGSSSNRSNSARTSDAISGPRALRVGGSCMVSTSTPPRFSVLIYS